MISSIRTWNLNLCSRFFDGLSNIRALNSLANNKGKKYSKNEQQEDLEYNTSGLCPNRFTGTIEMACISNVYINVYYCYLPWLPNITMNTFNNPTNIALKFPN